MTLTLYNGASRERAGGRGGLPLIRGVASGSPSPRGSGRRSVAPEGEAAGREPAVGPRARNLLEHRAAMKPPRAPSGARPRRSDYWMRAVSFAGLHRLLRAVAARRGGLRAGEINELVINKRVILTPRNSRPKPTTLYHYRNTLLQLGALQRDGRRLIPDAANPHVRDLLDVPAPADGEQFLAAETRESFAALVLDNDHCRSLFFDLFMPSGAACSSLSDFRARGVPVDWDLDPSFGAPEVARRNRRTLAQTAPRRRSRRRAAKVVLRNRESGREACCSSHVSLAAVLYGLRYWARDELRIIDEYRQIAGATTMFPVAGRNAAGAERDAAVSDTVRFLLSLRAPGEWAFFSVLALIERCCEQRRQPITVLFAAIDALLDQWRHDVVLIPTSRGMATFTARSPQEEDLVLRRYYTRGAGPYISHIRIHETVTAEPWESTPDHVQHPSEARA